MKKLQILDRLIAKWQIENGKKLFKKDLAKKVGLSNYRNFNNVLYVQRQGKVFNNIALFFDMSPEELLENIVNEIKQ